MLKINKSKRLLLMAHCILNQNAVVNGLQRAPGAFNEIVQIVLENNIGILQLPCPEFELLGEDRLPMTKLQYSTPDSKALSIKLAQNIVDNIQKYVNSGYHFAGIVGISQSPSCDISGDRGVFMETMMSQLTTLLPELKIFEIPEDFSEATQPGILAEFREFLS